MQIISDDNHRTSARAVCVVRLVSTADNRTERLRLLLTASNSCHCIARTYLLIQPLLVSVDFQRNKRHPQIVASQKRAVKKIVVILIVFFFLLYILLFSRS